MLLSMAGCGSQEPDPGQEKFTFTYHDIQIQPGDEAAPVTDALGAPKSYTEEASCAFEGVDKTYYYGSFYLSTYPMEGVDYVYSIWFVDDTVATAENIRIGSTQSQVEQTYGMECFNGTNGYTMTKGQSKLTILIEEGLVSSIRYEAVLE